MKTIGNSCLPDDSVTPISTPEWWRGGSAEFSELTSLRGAIHTADQIPLKMIRLGVLSLIIGTLGIYLGVNEIDLAEPMNAYQWLCLFFLALVLGGFMLISGGLQESVHSTKLYAQLWVRMAQAVRDGHVDAITLAAAPRPISPIIAAIEDDAKAVVHCLTSNGTCEPHLFGYSDRFFVMRKATPLPLPLPD